MSRLIHKRVKGSVPLSLKHNFTLEAFSADCHERHAATSRCKNTPPQESDSTQTLCKNRRLEGTPWKTFARLCADTEGSVGATELYLARDWFGRGWKDCPSQESCWKGLRSASTGEQDQLCKHSVLNWDKIQLLSIRENTSISGMSKQYHYNIRLGPKEFMSS